MLMRVMRYSPPPHTHTRAQTPLRHAAAATLAGGKQHGHDSRVTKGASIAAYARVDQGSATMASLELEYASKFAAASMGAPAPRKRRSCAGGGSVAAGDVLLYVPLAQHPLAAGVATVQVGL